MLKTLTYSHRINIDLKLCIIAIIFHLTMPFIHVLDVVKSDAFTVKAAFLKLHQGCQHFTDSSSTTTLGQERKQSNHDSTRCPICSTLLSSRKIAVLNSSYGIVTTKLFLSFLSEIRTNFSYTTFALTSPRSPPFVS